mmetsp:Transcript_113697/g.226251  ORF Transcript_113697/g.226251 Transcript_113697/m.226251 type:complete len:204 (+) Transcript_113697:754-1365(+)
MDVAAEVSTLVCPPVVKVVTGGPCSEMHERPSSGGDTAVEPVVSDAFCIVTSLPQLERVTPSSMFEAACCTSETTTCTLSSSMSGDCDGSSAASCVSKISGANPWGLITFCSCSGSTTKFVSAGVMSRRSPFCGCFADDCGTSVATHVSATLDLSCENVVAAAFATEAPALPTELASQLRESKSTASVVATSAAWPCSACCGA